jgi:hypothetical protein
MESLPNMSQKNLIDNRLAWVGKAILYKVVADRIPRLRSIYIYPHPCYNHREGI